MLHDHTMQCIWLGYQCLCYVVLFSTSDNNTLSILVPIQCLTQLSLHKNHHSLLDDVYINIYITPTTNPCNALFRTSVFSLGQHNTDRITTSTNTEWYSNNKCAVLHNKYKYPYDQYIPPVLFHQSWWSVQTRRVLLGISKTSYIHSVLKLKLAQSQIKW